jgi:hypothetical protein
LVKALTALAGREKHFDHVLIETTGLADPAPVALVRAVLLRRSVLGRIMSTPLLSVAPRVLTAAEHPLLPHMSEHAPGQTTAVSHTPMRHVQLLA